MSRICFICQTLIGGRDDPIKDSNLLRTLAAFAKSAAGFDLETFLDGILEEI